MGMAERAAEVAALTARMDDRDDPYDAHHGNDRSPAALERARIHNPPLYQWLLAKIVEEGDSE